MTQARRELVLRRSSRTPSCRPVAPAEARVVVELGRSTSAGRTEARGGAAAFAEFACRLSRSQSGIEVALSRIADGYIKSFQFRVVVVLMPAGLPIVMTPSMYLPRLTLTAVFPLPNRS